MWQPNRRQWWVIWPSALLAAALCWNSLDNGEAVEGVLRGLMVAGLGTLLAWQLADR